MKLSYFSDTGTLYIDLADRPSVVKWTHVSRPLNEGLKLFHSLDQAAA